MRQIKTNRKGDKDLIETKSERTESKRERARLLSYSSERIYKQKGREKKKTLARSHLMSTFS